MREDTMLALATAVGVGIVGLLWFLYLDKKQQDLGSLDPTELWKRCYRIARSRGHD